MSKPVLGKYAHLGFGEVASAGAREARTGEAGLLLYDEHREGRKTVDDAVRLNWFE